MAMNRRAVIGVFDEPGMADRAIDALQNAGFSSDQIHHSGRAAAATGGFFEGVRRFFTGEDATTGGSNVARDLTGTGVSNEEAQYYENEYNAGRTVVSVNAAGREQEAMNILQTNGAYSYATRRGAAQTDYTTTGTTTDATQTSGIAYNADRTGTAYTDTTQAATGTTDYDRTQTADYANETDEQRRLKLREEQLNVDKQRMQTGEVGLHKDVVEEQKTVNVPVTHEEVYVQQHPVTEGTVDDATPIGEGENIRVPVSEERVNVDKNTVVTGEVGISKRPVQETQQVSDTIRHEEARLDSNGNPIVQGDNLNTTTRSTSTDTTDTTDATNTRNSY